MQKQNRLAARRAGGERLRFESGGVEPRTLNTGKMMDWIVHGDLCGSMGCFRVCLNPTWLRHALGELCGDLPQAGGWKPPPRSAGRRLGAATTVRESRGNSCSNWF